MGLRQSSISEIILISQIQNCSVPDTGADQSLG